MNTRAVVLSLTMLLWVPGLAQEAEPEEPPLQSGLEERTGRDLVQVLVTVSGDPQQLTNLSRDDFRLWVRGIPLHEFTVDPLLATDTDRSQQPPVVPPALPATFLFYFDQPLLTPGGRQRAIEVARELVHLLIDGRNRALIVSSGRELETYTGPTSDVDELLAALDELEQAADQQDPYAAGEVLRIAELRDEETAVRRQAGMAAWQHNRENPVGADSFGASPVSQGAQIGGSSSSRGPLADMALAAAFMNQEITARSAVDHAVRQVRNLARLYQQEEAWQARRSLERLEATLAALAGDEPPKALVYFADIFRLNPGQHYLEQFTDVAGPEPVNISDTSFLDVGMFLNQLLDRATAFNVRFFTVQAEGLVAFDPRGGVTAGRDAQSGLASLAVFTGGRAFLNGAEASGIAAQMLSDLAHGFLISIRTSLLPEGDVLPIRVAIRRPGVHLHHPGRIVLQSGDEKEEARLLAALVTPNAELAEVRPTLVPVGFVDGRFTAIVQVGVPGASIPGASWDLGASAVSRGRVLDSVSARLTLETEGAAAIIQRTMSFDPGPYELIAIAHNLTTDEISSRRRTGVWPDPGGPPAIGPIALLQPLQAAISTESETRTAGPVALDEDQLVRSDRSTALLTVVCARKPVLVERSLVGAQSVDFPVRELDLGKQRCALIQDIIPAGTIGGGAFEYLVQVRDDRGAEPLTASREFHAVRPSAD